ncbi:MAG: hypothetical protein P8Y66_00720 [Nitrospirota bacterium]|jgi:polyhydroxyalkanoate synthesis regulator phasin
MDVFESVRKALLAGFGMQDKVREYIDELVKKGEISESQGAKLVKEWSEKAEKSTTELNETIAEVMSKTLQRMNLSTKGDIDKLNKEMKTLSSRIERIEKAQKQQAGS